MTTPRPHAELQKQWLDDDTLIRWRWFDNDKEWLCTPLGDWHTDGIYAVSHTKPAKPPQRTCTLGGLQFPAPETVAPAIGTKYWVANSYLGIESCVWDGIVYDYEALDTGFIHLTYEAATLHRKAFVASNQQAIGSTK